MRFGDLSLHQRFTRGSSDLVWTKTEPFTAYGYMKNQNAAACFSHPLRSVWHYDHISDDEEINAQAN